MVTKINVPLTPTPIVLRPPRAWESLGSCVFVCLPVCVISWIAVNHDSADKPGDTRKCSAPCATSANVPRGFAQIVLLTVRNSGRPRIAQRLPPHAGCPRGVAIAGISSDSVVVREADGRTKGRESDLYRQPSAPRTPILCVESQQ
jgi:hypothetical protein